jgi:DUF4097 and DUF4098 domain-containing protein YvlB
MRVISTSLIVSAALALTNGTVAAQQQFSGNWSVGATSERGTCNKAYRYPVVIENGTVRSGGPSNINVSGRVHPDGSIQSSVERALARTNVTGRLADRSGAGTWTTSGSVNCSGRWRAIKQS